MNRLAFLTVIFLLISGGTNAEDFPVSQQIAEALAPLPKELQAGATIIRYDSAGKKTVLREGTNHMVCTADSPFAGFSVFCYPKSLQGYRDQIEESWGRSEAAFRDTVFGEHDQGEFDIPVGTVLYMIHGAELDNGLPITVVHLPNATAESTGLPTTYSPYRPWLMFTGTRAAHVMIPGK